MTREDDGWPSADEVAEAKDAYQRALEVLTAEALRLKREMVGQCFKTFEQRTDDPSQRWPVYIAVTGFDKESRQLQGWHFQHTTDGEITVRLDAHLQAGFLGQQCVPVERGEFIVAFNETLTALARFASRIPTE